MLEGKEVERVDEYTYRGKKMSLQENTAKELRERKKRAWNVERNI